MNLNNKIQIPPDEPFKNDVLGRKEIGVKLTTFLKNTEDPIVLSIDAEWGQGKTTFLKMWREKLKAEGFTTLYYSAWENDYNNDALITIIGELENEIDNNISLKHDRREKISRHLQATKAFGSNILKNSLPFLIRILTSGVVDLDKYQNEFDSLIEEVSRKQIEEYNSSKNDVLDFKDSLSNLAADLNDTDENRPMIIMIDELDRCRPDFALEVLEKVKHFFLTPNVVFVLAIDKKQLIESIKTVYGTGLNSSGYLKRFIDIEFSLPAADPKKYSEVLEKKFGLTHYINNAGDNLNRRDANQVLLKIKKIIGYFDCSLREIEKCYAKISYTFKITNIDHSLFPIITSFLIVLSIKHYGLYRDFSTNKINVDTLFELLSKKSTALMEFIHSHEGIIVWRELMLATNQSDAIANKISEMNTFIENNPDDSDRKLIQERYEQLSKNGFRYGAGYISYVLQNIEMVNNFTTS